MRRSVERRLRAALAPFAALGADGPGDHIDCGPGTDTGIIDRGDSTTLCELVRTR